MSMKIDLEKLEILLKNQQWDAFKKEVADFLASPILAEEREEFNIKLLSVYLDVRNRMDAAYIEHLDDCLAVVKHIDDAANKIEHEVSLEEVRKKVDTTS